MIPSPLWQLDLSGNELCGLDEDGDGDYTAEGIIALAEALKVNASFSNQQESGPPAPPGLSAFRERGLRHCHMQYSTSDL